MPNDNEKMRAIEKKVIRSSASELCSKSPKMAGESLLTRRTAMRERSKRREGRKAVRIRKDEEPKEYTPFYESAKTQKHRLIDKALVQ